MRTIAEISGTEKKNIHRPSFTHQLFNEEKIVGYADGEVNIRVVYSAKSLEFLVEIKTIDDDPIRFGVRFPRCDRVVDPSRRNPSCVEYVSISIGMILAQKERSKPMLQSHVISTFTV